MVNKKEIEKLMSAADTVLTGTNNMVQNKEKCIIPESYNGQVAALGVSISIIGLIPTLAIYYQDNDTQKANRRTVLDIIASILDKHYKYDFKGQAKKILEFALDARKTGNNEKLDKLKKDVVNSSLALKQIIRTYKLE